MKAEELLDSQEIKENGAEQRRMRYAFTIFALLDIVSFMRSLDGISAIIRVNAFFDIVRLASLILFITYLATAVLFMLKKKLALLIYFGQFPLRIFFFSLSFGFLKDLIGNTHGQIVGVVLISSLFALEIARLIYSIILYRKYS